MLLEILRSNNICNEDELRMIQFLLSETTLRAKIDGKQGPTFSTPIGTPQGDGISHILFLIYFAHILYAAEATLRERSLLIAGDHTLTYADDHMIALNESPEAIAERESYEETLAATVDPDASPDALAPSHDPACSCVKCHSQKILLVLSEHLAEYRMTMDPGKTLHREINSVSTDLDKTMGCRFDFKRLVESRRTNADVAFYSLRKLWLKDIPISNSKKLKVYNATCLPHFTHTGGALVLRQVDLDLLDSRHRAQLRKLLGFYYPVRISSQNLYAHAKTLPISIQLLKARWKLFGHINRGDPALPANKVMLQLLTRRDGHGHPVKIATWVGGKKKLLHKILCQDLKRLPAEDRRDLFGVTTFTNQHDLMHLRAKAQDRQLWRKAVHTLAEAAFADWKIRDNRIIECQQRAQDRVAERASARTRTKQAARSHSVKEAARRAASAAKTYAAGQTRGGGKGPRKLKPSKYQKSTSSGASASSGIRKFFEPK
jgi:hypothetical protein